MKRHLRREVAREASMMSVLAIVAIMAIAWWWFADRPSPFSGGDPQSQALREYVEAAKRGDCARVIAALSRRSRELAAIVVAGRSTVERNFCDYSPATADLSDFETDRIRRESVAGPIANVSASYTYERFFGFFGRGRNRYTYRLVSETAGGGSISRRTWIPRVAPTGTATRCSSCSKRIWRSATSAERLAPSRAIPR
jgi:hypothetical protein